MFILGNLDSRASITRTSVSFADLIEEISFYTTKSNFLNSIIFYLHWSSTLWRLPVTHTCHSQPVSNGLFNLLVIIQREYLEASLFIIRTLWWFLNCESWIQRLHLERLSRSFHKMLYRHKDYVYILIIILVRFSIFSGSPYVV